MAEDASAGELLLPVGTSRLFTVPMNLSQVLIGDTEIADVQLLSSRRVLLLGKSAGRTNLTLRGTDERSTQMLDLVVTYDIEGIKRKLHEFLPGEEQITVRATNSAILLSGEVTDLAAMEMALLTARSFARDGDVKNLLQIGGGQQVMLEVRIAEVRRNALRALGIRNLLTGSRGNRSYEISTGIPFTGSPAVNALFTWPDLLLRLEALEARGTAKTLAEPNIVALSGQEASFLAGGEFPVPVLQSGVSDSVTVEFKEYGVGLTFTPTVLSDRKIHLRLQTEVSTIDFENATSIAGTVVPALSTRRTATTVELGDGQSFAIAGLLQENLDTAISQLPGLGSIPVLGTLFRSSEFRRNETELAILIRARLVNPGPLARLRLPTDNFVPPSIAEQYLLGRLEGLESAPVLDFSSAPRESSGGLEGNYGHAF
jgi:pilus assembly protein CpaC